MIMIEFKSTLYTQHQTEWDVYLYVISAGVNIDIPFECVIDHPYLNLNRGSA